MGCWASFARPTPHIYSLTPAIPKEPEFFLAPWEFQINHRFSIDSVSKKCYSSINLRRV
jgi:hypothetical protein